MIRSLPDDAIFENAFMKITTVLQRAFARADQLVTAYEPRIRALTLGASAPERGECRHDSVVLGIFGGVGALVVSASLTMIALRYYVA